MEEGVSGFQGEGEKMREEGGNERKEERKVCEEGGRKKQLDEGKKA